MKSNICARLIIIVGFITISFISLPAWAARFPLLAMTSGPSPQISCRFEVSVDSSNLLTGAAYSCTGEDLETYGVAKPKTMNLQQLTAGVVFMRHDSYKIDIIKVSAQDLDSQSGGVIRVRYLKNAMLMSYGDFYAVLEQIGGRWIVYTRDEEGRRPITQMKVITGLLGVNKISTQ